MYLFLPQKSQNQNEIKQDKAKVKFTIISKFKKKKTLKNFLKTENIGNLSDIKHKFVNIQVQSQQLPSLVDEAQ